jgi:hypothetical protein
MGARRRTDSSDGLDRNDLKTLWSKVQRFVDLLADPPGLDRAFNDWNAARLKAGRPLVDRAVLDPLLVTESSLFVKKADDPPTYRWRHDRNGVDVIRQEATARAAAQPQPQQIDRTLAAMNLITAFAERLAALRL